MHRDKFLPAGQRPRKELDDDLSFGKPKGSSIKKRFVSDSKEEIEPNQPKVKSIFFRDIDMELLEQLKNIVYTKKLNGEPFANQSTVMNEALLVYIDSFPLEIKERPEYVKQIERRRSKSN